MFRLHGEFDTNMMYMARLNISTLYQTYIYSLISIIHSDSRKVDEKEKAFSTMYTQMYSECVKVKLSVWNFQKCICAICISLKRWILKWCISMWEIAQNVVLVKEYGDVHSPDSLQWHDTMLNTFFTTILWRNSL